MPFVITALAFVGLLGALNLLLTIGVIKRLREHTTLLAEVTPPPMVKVGQEVSDFETTSFDGQRIAARSTRTRHAGRLLLTDLWPMQGKAPQVRVARGCASRRAADAAGRGHWRGRRGRGFPRPVDPGRSRRGRAR